MDLSPVTTSHRWLNQDPRESGIYNSWDTYNTACLVEPLQNQLRDSGNEEYFHRWFNEFVPVVMRMQDRGFGHLDKGRWKVYRKKLRAQLDEVEGEMLSGVSLFQQREAEALVWAMQKYFEHPHRVKSLHKGYQSRLKKIDHSRETFFNSSKELKNFVFGTLGLKPAPPIGNPDQGWKRTPRSLSQDALVYILQHHRVKDLHARDFLHNLFHRSHVRTIYQRYLEFWTDSTDAERVLPTIKCGQVETLRLAYADPPVHQWPAEVRHLIVPRKGHVFVGRDLSQVEPRIMAYESGDPLYLQVIANNESIHVQNALDLFGMSRTDWFALPESDRKGRYAFTKSFFLGKQYGGNAETMKNPTYCPCRRCVEKVPPLMDLSTKDRKLAEARWEAAHPAITHWRQELVRQILQRGKRYTSRFGYTRVFLSSMPQLQREIYNFPQQHGAAQIVNRAMVELDRLGCPLVLQMHDELIAEVPETEADYWLEVMKEVMEAPVPEYNNARFPTEGKIGTDWGQLK